MPDLQQRRVIKEAAERVNEDFMSYINYIQENEIKLAKNTAHIPKKDCYEINKKFQCQPEDWEKPTRVQDTYIQLDFFYYCSLRLGLLRVVKRAKGFSMQVCDRLKEYLKEDVVTRYCLLLTIYLGEYMEKADDKFTLPSLGRMLKAAGTGNLLKTMWNSDVWTCSSRYGGSVKVMAVLGLVDIIWLEENDMLKEVKACKLMVNDIGSCVAMCGDLEEARHAEEEPVEYLWKQFCPVWGGNKKAGWFLDEDIEDRTGCVFCLEVSLAHCIRTIKISGHCTLDDLHYCIQEAVDFDNDHLYCFTVGRDKLKKEYFHPYCEERKNLADEVEIGMLPLEEGDVFSYLFDFGDSWHFEIKVKKITEEEFEGAEVIEATGKAPEQYNEW